MRQTKSDAGAGSRRGLRDIRTMSDLLTETSNPQRKFLKLAMLSMEKVRKAKERKSAGSRIQDIDSRLEEIEAESGNLLRLVEAERRGTAGDAPPRPAPSPSSGRGFRFRY